MTTTPASPGDPPPSAPPSFDISRSLARTIAVLRERWLSLLGLAIAVSVPIALSAFWVATQEGLGLSVGVVGVILVDMVVVLLWLASIVRVALDHLRGEPVQMVAAVMRCLPILPALLGAMILSSLQIVFGFLLLLIPGFVWMVALSVTLPACVAEGRGPLASMRRSKELTYGSKLAIAFLVIALAVVDAVGSTLLGQLRSNASPSAWLPVAKWAWSGLTMTVSMVMSTVIYDELRSRDAAAGPVARPLPEVPGGEAVTPELPPGKGYI